MLMDIRDAAFGLDVRNASRVYFLHPVLNSQVEAQAIGRARRISQKRDVTVETLVLKDSFEAFLVKRRGEMTAGEQRQCSTILDDKPIKAFIENAKILPLPDVHDDGLSQTSMLQEPQYVFGRTFARSFMVGLDNPDEDLVALPSPTRPRPAAEPSVPVTSDGGADGDGDEILYDRPAKRKRNTPSGPSKKRRVAFNDVSEAEPSSVQSSPVAAAAASSTSNPRAAV
jgi:hypothetical protein